MMAKVSVASLAVTASAAKPFLRWAGGKQSLLPELLPRMPANYGRYFEPFLGAGALYWAVKPASASISDANAALIETYAMVERHSVALIKELEALELLYNDATMEDKNLLYYQVRAKQYHDPIAAAARFIFLNKTCFNGLYRVNAANQFNVPFGKLKHPTICDSETINACAQALRSAYVSADDFETSVADAEPGDFVYFDPPYDKAFTDYTPGGFQRDAQVRLAALCNRLQRKHVHFMLSSSDTPAIRDLYDGFTIESLEVQNGIGGSGAKRGKRQELIIRNY